VDDEPALLAAILADPDEDTPRLAYADWLDEHGRPERAEFIRLQCRSEPDEWQEERVYELEEAHRGRWLAQLGAPQFAEARWEFRRGFPEHLTAPGELFLDRYDAFARAPWLRSLRVYDLSNQRVRDLVSRPWNSRWVELELFGEPADPNYPNGGDALPAAEALASCRQVGQLRRLCLVMFPFGADAHRELEPLRRRLGDRLVIE
jgi:uncharacterized protein (TIGR02996 family)